MHSIYNKKTQLSACYTQLSLNLEIILRVVFQTRFSSYRIPTEIRKQGIGINFLVVCLIGALNFNQGISTNYAIR